ncbi:hypothetical protein SDC9_102692 [bioreactor metagenome]|uniref:Uncharacterized protein n=1 Tax=bioreactor metagenome TaxID=1076179 RepID=A0A645B2F9_9ZZZZ
MHFTKGTAFNSEVLCEHIDQTAVNSTITSCYAFARKFFFLHTEVCATVLHEAIEFYKAAFIKEQCDSLTSSQFAAFMLFCNTFFAACCHDLLGFFDHFLNSCLSRQIITPPSKLGKLIYLHHIVGVANHNVPYETNKKRFLQISEIIYEERRAREEYQQISDEQKRCPFRQRHHEELYQS